MSGIPGFHQHTPEPVAQPLIGYRTWLVCERGFPNRGPLVQAEDDSMTEVYGSLHGVFKSAFRWGAGTNTAVCMASWRTGLPYAPPENVAAIRKRHEELILPQTCGCGFWAYGEETMREGQLLEMNRTYVMGAIEGWGRIVVGPKGFRAHKARVVALCLPEQLLPVKPELGGGVWSLFRKPKVQEQQLVSAIRQAYPDVPVFEQFEQMAAEFPASAMEGYLPPQAPPEEGEKSA